MLLRREAAAVDMPEPVAKLMAAANTDKRSRRIRRRGEDEAAGPSGSAAFACAGGGEEAKGACGKAGSYYFQEENRGLVVHTGKSGVIVDRSI
jgi:hypothetical protein